MPKLLWTGFRWELQVRGSGDYKQAREDGWHWDWVSKILWTGVTEIAEKYRQYADSRAKEKFTSRDMQVASSKATTTTSTFLCPEGLAYLPFQRAGIEFALGKQNTLIADELGLGKTVEALGVINSDPSIKSILVICPASLLLNWGNELQKWIVRKLSGDYAASSKFPNSDIVLMNYDIAHKLKSQIQARQWDLHIYDEGSHFCKNEDTKRTQAIFGHSDRAKHCFPIEARKKIILDGTPILNRPIELWPTLRVLDPEGLGQNFWLFARRYCGGENQTPGMRDFMGATNLDVLQQRLRAGTGSQFGMIRRLKRDVLPELPPKRRQIIALPLPEKVAGIVQAELNFYDHYEAEISAAADRAETAQAAGDKESFEQAGRDLKDIKKVIFEELAKLRHDTGVAKVPYVIKYIEEKLEETGKVAIFAHHHDCLIPIAAHFGSQAVMHHGNMSMAQKQVSVDRFQSDSSVRVFVGGITTAQGYTITAANYAIVSECDWRPTIVTQAEDRLHRIGQKNPVLIQHVCFEKSLDARMIKKIIDKQTIIDAAIGG